MRALILSAALAAFNFTSYAQPDCSNGRYDQEIFTNFNVTTDIPYGSNTDVDGNSVTLEMDVYEPASDTVAERPLIIMAHGGSFISGDKGGDDVKPLCEQFAKKGYVTASINYRLGIENFPFPGPDSADASEAVLRATQDARAAVRFFRKSAAENGNPYGIDTNFVFLGGSSAGGFMALHLAYMDEVTEIPAFIDTNANGLSGGITGQSGNPGYADTVNAIINLSGAVGDTAWMKPNDTPVFSIHGDVDQTVPFGSEVILLLGQYPLLEVDGSYSVHHQAQKLGITECFKPFYGADHVPFCCGHQNEQQYYDTTSNYMRDFLLHFVCNAPFPNNCANVVGLNEPEAMTQKGFEIYPNPSEGVLNISTKEAVNITGFRIYNIFGQQVKVRINQKGTNLYQADFSMFPTGMYFVVSGDQTKRFLLK